MRGRLLPLFPMIGHSSAGTIHNPLQGLSWLWLAEAKNEQLLPGQAGKQSTTWSMLSWPVIESQVQAHAGCSLACSKLLLAPAMGPSLFLSPISLFGAVTCSARASGVKKVCNVQAPDRQALPGHQRAHPQRAPAVQDLLPDLQHVDHDFQETPQRQAVCPSFGKSELAHVSGITGTGHHSSKITKARQLGAAPKVTTFLCWVLFSTGLPSQNTCIYCSA